MSTTVKTGWLKDSNGEKFAPKTLTSQVQTSDGILLEDKIQADLNAAREDILANVSIDVDSALSSTSANPVQNKVIDAKFKEVGAEISALESDFDAHNHNNSYDTKGAANTALESAKSYTDTKTTGLASETSVNTKVNAHNSEASAHSDIRALIAELETKVTNFLDVDDTTTDQLSEVLTLITNNNGTLESLTSSKINVSDIVNDLTTSSTSKVLSAAQGVAIKTLIDALETELDDHTHAIADVSGLQSALDGKAASSHGTHVEYSTTAPVMDGTASVGSAGTVARSDHKHPTDTSRASKTEFDTHVSSHAPSNAEKNQNAFSNIAVSGQTTVAADTATDTVTFAGSNVTITTDATNDKVTFSVADGSTSAKGLVQLTNSTSSTSTTTAATPNSVKSAYDLANQAKTAAATAQSTADGKANTGHKHTKSEITDFPTSMPASDVSAWAKASSKPTYTASEVGAVPTTEKGAANGVATLGSDKKVLPEQLPDISSAKSSKATLTASGWTPGSDDRYYQTIFDANVTANTAVVVVDVDLSTTDTDAKVAYLEAWGTVSANEVVQGSGTLTFYACEFPTINIPINVGVM